MFAKQRKTPNEKETLQYEIKCLTKQEYFEISNIFEANALKRKLWRFRRHTKCDQNKTTQEKRLLHVSRKEFCFERRLRHQWLAT